MSKQCKYFWVSAFQDDDSDVITVRYHPVVGCGEYYNDGITEGDVKANAVDIFKDISNAFMVPHLDYISVFHCSFDGWVAEGKYTTDECSWAEMREVLEGMDPELSDQHLEYVDFNQE
jgi:hypothetical protein